jgi:hypothetical protein
MIKPAELSSEAKAFLKAQDAEIIPHKLVFDYDYWVAGEDEVRLNWQSLTRE